MALFALVLLPGCTTAHLASMDRYARGLVVILPGIEGRSIWNTNIADGLERGGVSVGIEIYDWSVPLPLGVVVNVADLERNRRKARQLAERIAEYGEDFPGRPVFLIGHSAGAGLAVLTLEALPADRRIAGAILLAAAVSPEHDLTEALRRTQAGIWSFYSRRDVGFLGLGTRFFGTVDRRYGSAAGAVGFKEPAGLDEAERRFYREKLHQVKYSRQMARSGHPGTHTGWANSRFVRDWLAPLVLKAMNRGPEPTPAPGPARTRPAS